MVSRFVFENKQTNVFLEQMRTQQHLLFSSKTKNNVPFFVNPKQMFFFFFVKLPEAILGFASSVVGTFLDKVPTFVHVKNSLPENENRWEKFVDESTNSTFRSKKKKRNSLLSFWCKGIY
jgi:hypothetical protein